MGSITLSKLKNSVGKRLKFKTFCFVGDNYDKLEDIFYATLLSVSDDCIVVEQISIDINKDDKITLIKTERTLYFGKFKIDNEIPLNH